MKKYFLVFLSGIIISAVSSCSDNAPKWDIGADGPQTVFAALKDGTLTISGKGRMKDLRGSDRPWHEYRDAITEIVIKNGVTSIGNSTFEGCANLTSITISNSVTEVGGCAFSGCTRLTSVRGPFTLEQLKSYDCWMEVLEF